MAGWRSSSNHGHQPFRRFSGTTSADADLRQQYCAHASINLRRFSKQISAPVSGLDLVGNDMGERMLR